MAPSDLTSLEAFEQLCHDVNNPLMVVSGHAYLLERYVLRLPTLPQAERDELLAGLMAITKSVQATVQLMDAERAQMADTRDFEVRQSLS